MGICLSCLGLSRKPANDTERAHLLPSDDTYNASGYGYGSTSQGLAPRPVLNPEEAKREQEALDRITRWTTDAVVDIFPHHTLLGNPGHYNNTKYLGPSSVLDQLRGDGSSQIRIYPASRPASQASAKSSVRSQSSSHKASNGKVTHPRIFRTLNMGPES